MSLLQIGHIPINHCAFTFQLQFFNTVQIIIFFVWSDNMSDQQGFCSDHMTGHLEYYNSHQADCCMFFCCTWIHNNSNIKMIHYTLVIVCKKVVKEQYT